MDCSIHDSTARAQAVAYYTVHVLLCSRWYCKTYSGSTKALSYIEHSTVLFSTVGIVHCFGHSIDPRVPSLIPMDLQAITANQATIINVHQLPPRHHELRMIFLLGGKLTIVVTFIL